MSHLVAALEANPHKPVLDRSTPVLTHLVCMSEAIGQSDYSKQAQAKQEGFLLDSSMRKALLNPRRWPRIATQIDRDGTRDQRFIIRTSQAVDMVTGGVKANALPESVTVLVNHRILDPTDAIKQRFLKTIQPVADKYNLRIVGFGNTTVSASKKPHGKKKKTPSAGTLTLSVDQQTERTWLSPMDSDAYKTFAATIKHVFPGTHGRERRVSGTLMTGNTDARSFLKLSGNIWRFNPSTFGKEASIHTVNEHMSVKSHVGTTRFLHAFLQNMH